MAKGFSILMIVIALLMLAIGGIMYLDATNDYISGPSKQARAMTIVYASAGPIFFSIFFACLAEIHAELVKANYHLLKLRGGEITPPVVTHSLESPPEHDPASE